MNSLIAITILASAARFSSAPGPRVPCLRYEPDTVRISGTLARHTYYGAPGFGEDTSHDEKEVGFYLDLSTPVCTAPGRDDVDAAQAGIRRVQLVLDAQGYAQLRPFLGKRVTLRGTLSAAFSGHHHTPVLLSVLTPAHAEP